MSTAYLFSHNIRKYGWILLILGSILGLWYLLFSPELSTFSTTVFAIIGEETLGPAYYFRLIENNILDELICIVLIAGALLVAFSKEKLEDEFIMKLRLESLIWATWANYIILLLIIVFIYDGAFFTALLLHMVTILLLFIGKFRLALSSSENLIVHEE